MKDALSRLSYVTSKDFPNLRHLTCTQLEQGHFMLCLVYNNSTRPWGRNLLPRCMLSNAEGELPCWYPFATEQFRLGLSYDLIPRLAAGGSAAICS